ncbi:hypothetical protein Bbelb_270210 [Branchiostoma belcheri]|nr:hypothetical protein Bbelb_270210 [Branchiostoma belcheri]
MDVGRFCGMLVRPMLEQLQGNDGLQLQSASSMLGSAFRMMRRKINTCRMVEEQNVWLPQNVPHSPAGRIALSRRTYRTLPEDVPHSPEGSPAQRPALSRRTSLEN